MRRRKKKRGCLIPFLLILAAGIAVGFAVLATDTVREIRVVGNRKVPTEEIVELSGIRIGSKRRLLSVQDVRKRVESNYSLEFSGLDFDYKGTLTIRIRERTGIAAVWQNGFCYVLDREGMVIGRHTDPETEFSAGPVILGIRVMTGATVRIGAQFPAQDDRQMETLRLALSAMQDTNMLTRSASLSLQNEEDLVIATRERASIRLGDRRDLTVKLLIAREVLNLRKDEPGGLEGVWIDVSSGKDAHYIPKTLPTVTPTPTDTPAPTVEETGKKKKKR